MNPERKVASYIKKLPLCFVSSDASSFCRRDIGDSICDSNAGCSISIFFARIAKKDGNFDDSTDDKSG